ncbi:MAG TPA: NUDIX hydrolase [Steroidobacteraceae bacterium]|nr:NUDIX hydrolase [Steroidobacteraceae bacterium]HRX89724.1 NUDIX hydrolase [Steroidobacteraceae bacterium]
MNNRPAVTVAAIAERDGRYLLIEERIRGRLVITQPGGHVEDRETLLDAVVRETLEESACSFTPTSLVGTYLWRNPLTEHTSLRFTFAGTVEGPDSGRTLDRGIERALWLSGTELRRWQSRLRSPLVLRCIDDYEAGRCAPLESVQYLDLESACHVRAVVNL